MPILLLAQDLFFSSRIEGAAQRAGRALQVCPSVESLLENGAGADLVVLDLAFPELDVAALVPRLRGLEPPPRRVIAFGQHVFADLLAAAEQAGCDAVLTRGRFDREMVDIFRAHGESES